MPPVPPATRADLLRLAVPAALTAVVHSLYRLNDQFFVQPLGVEAQAAVAVAGMLGIGLFGFAQLVGVGALAVAGRRLGEGRDDLASAAVRSAVRLGFAIGVALALALVAAAPALAEVLVPPDSPVERRLLADYLHWLGTGQLVLVVLPAIDAAFLIRGRARVPLVLESLGILTNAGLNALLVPRYGVEGAGIATACSRIPSLLLGLWLLPTVGVAGPLRGATSLDLARRVARVGVPVCLSILFYSLVYQAMLATTFRQFDAGGRSALGPGFGLESVWFCGFWGVAQAVGALVSRELGAGRPEHAATLVRFAVLCNLGVGLGAAVLFWLGGPTMVRWFADDELAVAANVVYLRWMAPAQPFAGMRVCYEQCLAGAGRTRPLMWSTSVMNGIRVPLAWLLALPAGMGLAGVWLAIDLSSVGKWIWAALLFRGGAWKTHRV